MYTKLVNHYFIVEFEITWTFSIKCYRYKATVAFPKTFAWFGGGFFLVFFTPVFRYSLDLVKHVI